MNESSHLLLNKLQKHELKNTLLDGGAIIEIGATRSGTDATACSSYFFKSLADNHKINFFSVDLSLDSYQYTLQNFGKEHAIHSDGESFLEKYKQPISILYLDGCDVVYSNKHRNALIQRAGNFYPLLSKDETGSLQNNFSANSHLIQIRNACKQLTKNSIVIIDDTLRTNLGWWGKGATVVPFLLRHGFIIKARSDKGVLLQKASFKARMEPKNLIYLLFQKAYTGKSPIW